jgi:putative oxidoreductase
MIPFFSKHKDIGLLIFRLFIGIRLLYGVIDNILHWDRMLEFESFLKAYHFPYPLISAIVSVYMQALAGIMIIVGYKIRWAAFVMLINFTIALFMVHKGQTFEEMTSVLSMLFSSLLFLFTGSGKYGLDREPLSTTSRIN